MSNIKIDTKILRIQETREKEEGERVTGLLSAHVVQSRRVHEGKALSYGNLCPSNKRWST